MSQAIRDDCDRDAVVQHLHAVPGGDEAAAERLTTRLVEGRNDETRGVHYDTGTVFRGPGYAISTRPKQPDMAAVRRELEIVRDDLHGNAVRIVGSDVELVTTASKVALDLGLEACFSPAFFEYEPEKQPPGWLPLPLLPPS